MLGSDCANLGTGLAAGRDKTGGCWVSTNAGGERDARASLAAGSGANWRQQQPQNRTSDGAAQWVPDPRGCAGGLSPSRCAHRRLGAPRGMSFDPETLRRCLRRASAAPRLRAALLPATLERELPRRSGAGLPAAPAHLRLGYERTSIAAAGFFTHSPTDLTALCVCSVWGVRGAQELLRTRAVTCSSRIRPRRCRIFSFRSR